MKAKTLVSGLMALCLVSCNGYFSGMDIPNEYEPDIETVMSDVSQYPSLIRGAYVQYWQYMNDYNTEPLFNMGTNADIFCPSAGNWDMKSFTYQYPGYEKPELNNSDPSAAAPKTRWYNFYGMINTVRNMLKLMNENDSKYLEGGVDCTYKILANNYMLMGMAYAEMALCFDKCFMLTEETGDVTVDDIKPASDIKDLAMGYFDKCIAICKANSFTNFDGTLPGGAIETSAKLEKMANFMAARLLAYFPRTNKETPEWSKVLEYAKNALDADVCSTQPGESNYDYWTQAVASHHGAQWTRPSMRIIKMMAPNDKNAVWPTPKDFTFDPLPEVTNCPDARLGNPKYFMYTNSIDTGCGAKFNATYSSYYFGEENRFCECGNPDGAGKQILFTVIESDLIYAEALANTGKLAEAANLVNKTRVANGELNDITASSSKDAIIEAIYYEMFVECCWTTGGTGWYNRRRTPIDKFQLTTRSYRQLPIPKVELDFYGLDTYTFGGANEEYNEYKF